MVWNASNLQVFVRNVVGYWFDSNKRLVKHKASVDGLRRLSRQPSWFDEDVKIAASWNTAEERLFKSPWLLDEEMQGIKHCRSMPHLQVLAKELLRVARYKKNSSVRDFVIKTVTMNFADLPPYLQGVGQQALLREITVKLWNRSICLDCSDPNCDTTGPQLEGSYHEMHGHYTGTHCAWCCEWLCPASLVTASAGGQYKACRQCFYDRGDPNVYGGSKCSVEDCDNTCAVTPDGLIVTCMSCHRTLCSDCDEFDQCASPRARIEAEALYERRTEALAPPSSEEDD
jgi:hypothetical protein